VDGVTWTAKGHVDGARVTKELTAGVLCKEVLQEIFKVLPVQMTPASSEDGSTGRRQGRPHGYQQWETDLAPSPVSSDTLPWQRVVSATLPSAEELELLYDESLGCGREAEEPACSQRTCSFCWRNRGKGLIRRSVVVFNHWGLAPAEVSGGAGTIRGCPVKDAASSAEWARSTASRGNDVEIYLTVEAQRQGSRGLSQTTLGRVAYFFEHQGNDWRRGDGSASIPEGEFTIWVAVSEYVTAGVGTRRKVDTVTGLDEFKMRRTLTFYPACAIRRVVHMMHSCPATGASACGLVEEGNKRPIWRCISLAGSTYLLNKYFHCVGRDSIA
ncbi:unnamed protein product, partial [Hapterophycus canaliculatus]